MEVIPGTEYSRPPELEVTGLIAYVTYRSCFQSMFSDSETSEQADLSKRLVRVSPQVIMALSKFSKAVGRDSNRSTCCCHANTVCSSANATLQADPRFNGSASISN